MSISATQQADVYGDLKGLEFPNSLPLGGVSQNLGIFRFWTRLGLPRNADFLFDVTASLQ